VICIDSQNVHSNFSVMVSVRIFESRNLIKTQ
jgi:hypothetical protein